MTLPAAGLAGSVTVNAVEVVLQGYDLPAMALKLAI
jgi:hypothetical protein